MTYFNSHSYVELTLFNNVISDQNDRIWTEKNLAPHTDTIYIISQKSKLHYVSILADKQVFVEHISFLLRKCCMLGKFMDITMAGNHDFWF